MPFFATDACDLIGILSIGEHTARAYPWRFFDEEWASDTASTTSTACRTRRSTSSATGIAVEIEYESALRAANEIETGVPPAVGYKSVYTIYMNKWRRYLLDDSKQMKEADGIRSRRRRLARERNLAGA